jgi:hypothetical protein
MPRVRALAALLVALAFVPGAGAAPFVVQLGAERIVLEAPPGFSDTGFLGSPRLQELAEKTTSASNRVLLFAIADADLRRFMAGERMELRRYMVVVTPRGMERERVGEAQFRDLVAASLRDLGAIAATPDLRQHLDAQPEAKAVLLAELRREPQLVSILQGARLVAEGGGFFAASRVQYVLATTTLVLVRGKALQLAVHSAYDAPQDLEWITAATARWIEELLRLNR